MLFKRGSDLCKSIIAHSSEILSAVKIPQPIRLNKIIDFAHILDVLKYQESPCLDILSGIHDFIENLPEISNPLHNHSDKSSDKDNTIKVDCSPIVFYQSEFFKELTKSFHNITKDSIFNAENHNISNSVNQSKFQSDSTVNNITSNAKYIHSFGNIIQKQIPYSTILNPLSISLVGNAFSNSILQCLNQKESAASLQWHLQEKDGLKCLGPFTYPALKQVLNNIETKSDALSIISKVMDTLKVLEYTNESAISTIDHPSLNNEQTISESNSVSDSRLYSNYMASDFAPKSQNSSIVKSLASVYNSERISQSNERSSILSGITVDRLIGSVNIHHSGSSLNDDNIKHELEQAVLAALSKILEQNLDDAT